MCTRIPTCPNRVSNRSARAVASAGSLASVLASVPRRTWLGWLGLVMLAAANCTHGSNAQNPPPTDSWRPASGYRPGASLNSSKLCKCLACAPTGCCAGADETQAECTEAAVTETADSVDFSANPACGLRVETCARACAERAWRVRADQTCNQRRPAECCLVTDNHAE
jgi:hypothetical protein